MKNSRLFGLAVALTFTLISAAFAADDKDKDKAADADLKKLEGQWTAPAGNGEKVTYTFEGKTLKVVAPSRKYEMTVTLDADAKPDKTIDFKINEAPEDAKGKTSKGIYKFADDGKFIFCFRPEGERPTKYETVGYEQIVVELTKAKKD